MKAPLTIRLRLQPVNGLHSFDYSLRDRFVGDMASASPARPCQGYAAFSKWRTRLSHSASRLSDFALFNDRLARTEERGPISSKGFVNSCPVDYAARLSSSSWLSQLDIWFQW